MQNGAQKAPKMDPPSPKKPSKKPCIFTVKKHQRGDVGIFSGFFRDFSGFFRDLYFTASFLKFNASHFGIFRDFFGIFRDFFGILSGLFRDLF